MLVCSRFLIFCMVMLLAWQAPSQPSDNGRGHFRARRAFERALEAYEMADYEQALTEAGKAIARSPSFVKAHLLRGEVFFTLRRFNESAQAFAKVVELADDDFPRASFYLGMSLLHTGHYRQAKASFQHFLVMPPDSQDLDEKARSMLVKCEFALEAIQNPVPFNPENPGPSVNTDDAEYSPAITADGETLVFTRRSLNYEMAAMGYDYEVENFYVSYLADGRWTKAIDLGAPINTAENEGAQSLSVDGRDLYFTACNRPGGFGSCDLYYSRRTGDVWQVPVNVGPAVNSSSWDSHPSVSPDGRSLFFSSGRGGGHGETDLWMATKDDGGRWQAPVNLGPVINTSGREVSPFIHSDNSTLYFASDGHPGMGGLDLFYSRRDENGQWSEPVNLGYPVNTHADEFSMVVDAAGKMAWYASDMAGGYGKMDIYSFDLYEEARPAPVTYMKGTVVDKDTGEPLKASFELIEIESESTVISSVSDEVTGDFLVVVPVHTALALHVSSPGYLFYSAHFHYEEARTDLDPYLEDIYLQPIQKGESVVLRNVFFDTGSFLLDPASTVELHLLASLLERNPGLHIQVGGHTDSVGRYEDNLVLSENRAKSVVDFLIQAGISPSRLTYAGYADSKPIDTNETEEGRANNRRTAFSVVETSP